MAHIDTIDCVKSLKDIKFENNAGRHRRCACLRSVAGNDFGSSESKRQLGHRCGLGMWSGCARRYPRNTVDPLYGTQTKRQFDREPSKFAQKSGWEFYWCPAGSIFSP
jgi:hypothetical protein